VKPRGEEEGRGYAHKVLAPVERATGQARSMVGDGLGAKDLTPILAADIAREARVMADGAGPYVHLGASCAEHGVGRRNKGERGRGEVHTTTLEGYCSTFKRGMRGVYQPCAKEHLHR
jgi:hypothetical protein